MRIEIAEDLLRGLRPLQEKLEALGTLYGQREGSEVRLIASQPAPGLIAMGISVCRQRGEVFLTESNLEMIEKQLLPVALVIAGNRAGFFVHASDGTMQTVRSHEEFCILEPPKPAPRPPAAPARKWSWAVAGWMALVALPVAALAYLRPAFSPKPITSAIEVQASDGELHIRWRPGAQAILEIQDGADHTAVAVSADQSRATYQPRSGEVEISLIQLGRRGVRRESARYLGAPPPLPARDQLYSDIVHIRARADELRAESAAQRKKMAALEKKIAQRIAP